MIDNTLAPLAFSQERVWFLQMLDPADRSYQFQGTLAFAGPLDIVALERSLDAIVARHAIFRTTFPAVDGAAVQRVEPHRPITLPIVDLGIDADAGDVATATRIARAVSAAVAEPFDVTQLPLVRWTLLRVSAEHHVLVTVEHHLVHDGWSFYVVLDELAQLYRAHACDAPLQLEAAPSFTDFAREQRATSASAGAADGLAYWKRTLAGAPALLHLPTDRPRPPLVTHAGDAIVRELPVATLRGLERLSRANQATMFMTMFAAFSVVLQRYSGDTDICVGTGVAGRDRPQFERLVGMLVNNVVLRVDLSGDPTFLEFLARVKRTAIDAYAHQHVPLDRVVEAVAPARDPSFNPLFSTMFAFHDSPYPNLDFGPVRVTLNQTVDNASAKMDLNVIAVPHPNGITLKWEYNRDLFDRSTMARMLDRFVTLVAGVIDEPERRISRFEIMPADERRIVLDEFARNPMPYDREGGIAARFAAVAASRPTAPALVVGGEAVSYAELDARSNRLAHFLRSSGVESGTRVGLLLERSPDAIVAMLAVLKTGGVYVPLTTRFPAERLAWILNDADVALTLTLAATRGVLPATAVTVCLDEAAARIAAQPAVLPPDLATADALAYVMYTSGSTGTPKGACITQRGIARLIAAGTPIAIGPGDVVANAASHAFDAATYEIWGALLNGAALAIVPAGALSLAELGHELRAAAVSVAFLTTPLFAQMVDSECDALAGLRLLIVGGDVLSPAHARRFLERCGATRLVNGYGPTENTTFTTLHEVTRETAGRRSIPLGRPIPNTTVYVLDAHCKPVPIDVPGELYTGGDGVADGYRNRAELTAERFIADPFAPDATGSLYRTGDLARWRDDGTLEFLGRVDDQVKVRGFRIELAAIESVLRAHPAVREAAVSVTTGQDGDKTLVAHVVAQPGTELDRHELRAFLARRLPDYEVPSRLTMLAALPAGVSGKIDRQQLAGEQRTAATVEHAPPRGACEERLAQLWETLLDVRGLSRQADFFDIGGHSLLAMRLLARLNDAFDVELPLHALFEHRTIAALAPAVEAAPKRAPRTSHANHGAASAVPPEAGLGDLTALTDAEIDALLAGDFAGFSEVP